MKTKEKPDVLFSLFQEITDSGKMIKTVFSRKRRKSDKCSRVLIRPVSRRDSLSYQIEYTYEKKVTHKNITPGEVAEEAFDLAVSKFKQINIITADEEIQVLANKPEKPRITRTCILHDAPDLSHDKKKNYVIPEGRPCDFLIHLGVMDEKGKVYKKHYSKFRQINRFLEIVDDVSPYLLKNAFSGAENINSEKDIDIELKPLRIIDFGCGKAYLTFALYYYFVKQKKIPCRITGLDLKDDVIKFCQKTADEIGYDGLEFQTGDIADYSDDAADMVVTLHACDTATDYALINAVKWDTEVILSVPCCQHELFRQIKNDVSAPMLKHGIIKDKFTELLTDGLRGLKLESKGYDVAMIEFTSLEHTSKNIMIKAVKARRPDDKRSLKAAEEYEKLKKEYHVSPSIDQMV